MSGITSRKYKSGSIIYFMNDRSEYIYILKSGRIVLTSTKIDTGEEVTEDVRTGEFFGVKSALGKYPREETAQTYSDTEVLVFTLDDFERLILRNVKVVKKMLRVFSNQLRKIGKMVRTILGEGENINPSTELFRIGEHYYKEGIYKQAEYAFKKYLEHYPDTKFTKIAMERIKAIASGEASTDDDMTDFSSTDSDQTDDSPDSTSDSTSDSDDMFGLDDSPSSGSDNSDDSMDFDDNSSNDDDMFSSDDSFEDNSGSTGTRSELSSELDDFIDGDSSDDFDDFFEDDDSDKKSGEKSLSGIFDEARNLFSSNDFGGALKKYKEISDNPSNCEKDKATFENAFYETGKCYFKLSKYKEAMGTFADVIKKFKNSPNVKNSLFYIGSIFEQINNNEKAKSYYEKVIKIKPEDQLTKRALNKIQQL